MLDATRRRFYGGASDALDSIAYKVVCAKRERGPGGGFNLNLGETGFLQGLYYEHFE